MQFSPQLDFTALSKRARGRRRYNEKRQLQARLRITNVLELLDEIGFSTHGYQSKIAKRLDVSRSTICRDLARLWRIYHGGKEADDRYRAKVRMDRQNRAEDKAEWERIEADALAAKAKEESAAPLLEPPHAPSPAPPGQPIQVPRWLAPNRSRRAGRSRPIRSRRHNLCRR